jgi:hypothetical protein
MPNGLTPQQQTQLQGILRTQFNLGQNNAQNFVNNGNQGLLGNLASQSNLTNSGSSSGSIPGSGLLRGGGQIAGAALKSATDVALAGFYDQLGNASNRITTSSIQGVLNKVVSGVSSLASLDIAGLLSSVFSAGGEAAAALLRDLAQTQAKLIDVTNKSGAFVGDLGGNMREELNDAIVATTQLGMTVDDFIDGTSKLMKDSGRMALYSKEAIESGVKASIAYTNSSKTILENSEAFRNVSYGIQDAAKVITAAGQKTLELGLNAKNLTDTLVKNLDKLNQYGFQNGINGMTKMLQQAQSLNFNVDNTFKIANDLFDPNKAIDMAANLSMIGGAIGDFGDPLRLIYDATNNVEGLQTSLINASKSLATYNSEQGRFEVTGANLRRAKMMADTFGISMSDLTSLAVKANVQFQAMSQIRSIFPTASKEQQEFIKNLSTMKDGKIGISIPSEVAEKFGVVDKVKDGFIEFAEFAKIDVDTRNKILKEQEKIAAMKPEDIARGQFNATTQILNIVSAMYLQQQNITRRSETGKKVGDVVDDLAKNLSGVEVKKLKTTQDLINAVTEQAKLTINKNFGNVTPTTQPTQPELKSSANQYGKSELKSSTNQNSNVENKNSQSNNNSQDVKIQMNITANDSTMDAMTRHWSKNLQDLELIGVKINNDPKSFDSTRKVFTKK